MKENFSFSVTSYEGYEDHVLRLLNNNRSKPHDRSYLDWRYLGEQTTVPPQVFWVHDGEGERVGMSSLIFRSYYADNSQHFFAVRADTSLNKNLRGYGLGKKLFQYMIQNVDQQGYVCAFALANIRSCKASEAAGWTINDSFSPYVMVIDPTDKLLGYVKNVMIAKMAGALYKAISKAKLQLARRTNLQLETVAEFDESFNTLWSGIDTRKLILRDRHVPSLTWRFSRHPKMTFSIKKVILDKQFVGFYVYSIVCDVALEECRVEVCNVYDLILVDSALVKQSMKLFLGEVLRENPKLTSVRVNMNNSHPYTAILNGMGFSRRAEDGVLTSYIPEGSTVNACTDWQITLGDKDV